MNEKKLLQSLEYIDDAYLLEAEKAMQGRKSWHIGRRIAMLVAAVLIFALTASAAYLVANWDEMFVERFDPTEAILAQSKDAIQEVAAMVQSKDVKMAIHQSLGDETYLYLTLDVTLPDDVDLYDYVTKDEETGEYRSLIMLGDIQVFNKPVRYQEVRGMDFEELCQWFGGSAEVCDSISVQNDVADPESNTLSYLVGLGAMEGQKLMGDLSLIVGSLIDFGTDTVIAEGPFTISWKASNESDVYRFDLTEKGTRIGEVVFSAFGLQISLDKSEYTTIEELTDKVTIVYTDGTESSPQGYCGGSIALPTGAVNINWEFDEIQLLDQVAEIRIDDYVCRLTAE